MENLENASSSPEENASVIEINYLELMDKNVASNHVDPVNKGERNSYLKIAVSEVADTLGVDRKSISTVSAMGAEATKSAFLFYPGKTGQIGYVALNAFDTASPSDPWYRQTADLIFGATKGYLMQEVLHQSQGHNIGDTMSRGVALGMMSRGLNAGLSTESFLDPETGKPTLMQVLPSIGNSMFSKSAIQTDVATVLLAGGTTSLLRAQMRGLDNVEQNPLVRNFLTAGTFGFSAGITNEVRRQAEENGAFNVEDMLRAGLLQGGLSGLSSLPGGIRTHYIQTAQRENNLRQLLESRKGTDLSLFKTTDIIFDGIRLTPGTPIRINELHLPRTKVEMDNTGGITMRSEGRNIFVNGREVPSFQSINISAGDKIMIDGRKMSWGPIPVVTTTVRRHEEGQLPKTVHENALIADNGVLFKDGIARNSFSGAYRLNIGVDSRGLYLMEPTLPNIGNVLKLNGKEIPMPVKPLYIKPTDDVRVNDVQFTFNVSSLTPREPGIFIRDRSDIGLSAGERAARFDSKVSGANK